MAKKPLLDATSRPPSAFSAFTAGYRLSSNVEDRRGKKQYDPTDTPSDYTAGMTSTSGSASRPKTEEDEMYGTSSNKGDTTPSSRTSGSTTRKVDAEEAIRRTHIERK